MASKAGRVVQRWNTPELLLFKVWLHYLYVEQVMGRREGEAAKRYVVDHFYVAFPWADRYFDRPPTADAIFGRAFTPSAPTHRDEHPEVHPKLMPYIPLAQQLLDWHLDGDPMPTQDSFETMVGRVTSNRKR